MDCRLIILPFYILPTLLSTSLAQNTSSGQKKEIVAHRLKPNEKVILDGKLEEPFWNDISASSNFRMQEPQEGDDPTESTEVRITYDRENLYIGVILNDSDPSGIKAFQRKRDAELDTDDRFRWIFDTFRDLRNAFFFEINPAGLRSDGLLTIGQGTTLNGNWDGIWDAKTVVGDFGWSAEIVIPFVSLNFDPNSDQWGVNFQRTIRRKNEELMWTGFRRNQGIFRPQDAGVLKGLSGISQGLGLEVVPYGILQRKEQQTGEDNGLEPSTDLDGGFDINYNITPGLEASLTVNTDFAEAEVDERQINLTRFPLFFPEQRDFFLEGAGIYEFAPSSGIDPFFSRRIGLVDGVPIPITYGGRLLGRMGDYSLALLQVRTGEKDSLAAENFTVARVKKNIGKESSLGVIYTRRAAGNDDKQADLLQDRHTIGSDLELNTSSFMGNNNLQFQAFFVYHNSPIMSDDSTDFWDRTSRGLRLNFPNQPWSGHVSYREFGDSFDPAVGFTPRNAFRRVQPSIEYTPLFEKSNFIRDISWGVRFEHLMDLDYEVLTQNLRLTLFELRLESGDQFELDIVRDFERLQQPFDIKRDGSVIIPEGKYYNWVMDFEFETASYRRVSVFFELEKGGFWSGDRTQYLVGLTLRPFSGINLTTQYIHEDINLREGDFTTDLIRFIGNIDLSPDLSFTSNIQFDNISDVLGMNNRFRWIITPGSDLFLVYNHNWSRSESRFMTIESTGTIKLSYTHRF